MFGYLLRRLLYAVVSVVAVSVAVFVITHEAAHATGCATEPCSIRVENKARVEVGMPVRLIP